MSNHASLTKSAPKETFVAGQTHQGLAVRGTLLKLTRFAAVFELHGSGTVLRLSEVIREFQITLQGRTLYAGKVVVRNLVYTGLTLVCEVTLNDRAWQDLAFEPTLVRDGRLGDQFTEFLEEWQKAYQVRPEYKLIVADLQTFLAGLRLWLQPIELDLNARRENDREHLEPAAAEAIAEKVIPCINTFFEQFETFNRTLPAEVLPAHRSYMRRQLHPLVLCAPFAHRTFHKPLGYAGDYEMVNMILRKAWEGDSLYAKIVNMWFLRQPPAEAHRRRIAYLADQLQNETLRVRHRGRAARIFNLGCGPAHEVLQFLRESIASESAAFTLLDFNEETLRYLATALTATKAQRGRHTPVTLVQKSVHQLLKEASFHRRSEIEDRRSEDPSSTNSYDFIYCAGLFDYLSDQVCRRLMDIMYGWLAPGGLLVATNVEPSNPLRHGMEHLLDWHLIYRTGPEMTQLRPQKAQLDQVRALTDETGTNVFLEVRKPSNG